MKVLLLDPAFSSVPIHDYLVGVGHEVWTIGNRVNDPLALSYPDRWIKGNYNDTDLVSRVIDTYHFDMVVPGCTDVSMETYVRVALQPHYHYTLESDQILSKKPLFRKLCDKLNLPAPHAVPIDQLPSRGRYICKPADSFSGRGVVVFDSADRSAASDAITHAKMHSPSGQVVCEEFIEGQLYSYSAFVENGNVDASYIVKEGSRYDQFSVDTSYLVDDYNLYFEGQVRASVESVCRNLGLCDGLLHVQFIDAGDRIALIEMTRRCPGDLYSSLIEYSTGHPYAARYASYFVGHKPPETVSTRRRFVLRSTIKQASLDNFRGFDLELGSGLFSLVPTIRIGEKLDPSTNMRVGIAFIEMPDQASLERKYLEMVSHSNY
ncbi:ATP-grasp domain-containing protein [Acidithiobacillus sulfurivorans]|uniref:ATP-grasp domain-containing protein n=1 Tax=Acidithiobacillus sulfurivorans TaxID=1958756 RepID=A0ABS5ZVC0_9PROT|nr:ATP-grasp domain-containing protein [Acidithiobacillus sulfurivorans]MBU2759072.1 ATP-grasp domain-containing protein [Acidithiobacillus sulfurivorans]